MTVPILNIASRRIGRDEPPFIIAGMYDCKTRPCTFLVTTFAPEKLAQVRDAICFALNI